jgi:Flp pilus assembly protein TadG
MKRERRSLGSRRGNALIEFALSAMVLTYAFVGVFQFGYSMYLYNQLEGAVRAGARYASLATVSKDPSSTSDPASYDTAVKNVVVYGTPSPSGSPTPVIPGLTTGNVDVQLIFDTTSSGNPPTYVTVKVSSYSLDAVVKTIVLTNKPLLKMPFMGQYCIISTSSC